jgi:hypothetical protein
MAKSTGKKATAKSPSGQKVSGGGSGKMHSFAGAGPQKPGVTATTEHKGKGAQFVQPGPSGKMHSFKGTAPQKSGRSGQS